ncbi:MAG: hypothetical protein IJ493_03665 [Clostridia bacterium]|nr:hypothetical protein [Clostridia bacterium]
MKNTRKLSLALCALTLGAALAFPTSAMKAVGDVTTAYGTPTVDGTITADEWKDAKSFTVDSTTAKAWKGSVPADYKATFSTLWDETNLYISGTIKDSAVTYSSAGSYNRDAIQLSIDLGQTFKATTESRAIFYSFGCYEKDAIVQRQESKNNAVVKDGENGLIMKTAKTADGWTFEAALPLAMLKEDCKLKSGKDVTVAADTKINVMVCYLDYDIAGSLSNAFGTTLTDENTKYDHSPQDHGITLTLAAKPAPVVETTAPSTADPIALLALASIASGAVLVISKKRK